MGGLSRLDAVRVEGDAHRILGVEIPAHRSHAAGSSPAAPTAGRTCGWPAASARDAGSAARAWATTSWSARKLPAIRVRLVTPDLALLDAAIDDRPALGRALDCEVAEGWDVFPQALQRSRDAVAADPGSTRWGTRLFVLDEPRTLVGLGGFKGPPRDGVLEIGYAVAPAWEGRGIATAAARELLREAFTAPGLQAVIAHTLPGPGASVRVLEKTGFVADGEIPDDDLGTTWRFRLDL